MPDTPYHLAQKFRAALLKREQSAALQMEGAYKIVQEQLARDITALLQQMKQATNAGKAITPIALLRLTRFRSLQRATEQELLRFGAQAGAVLRSAQSEALDMALDATKQILLSQSPTSAFFGLPTRAVEVSRAMTADTSPVRKIFRELVDDQKKQFTDTLIKATALGWHQTKTAQVMRDTLGTPLARSLTVSRTETLRAFREASRMASQEAGVVAWRWTASKSVRTCLSCLALDGKLFDVARPFPAHPNCRCVMIMLAPHIPAPEIEAGAQWFEKQPDEVKRQMMSKVAFEAYKKGEVKLGHFSGLRKNKIWGDMRYELSCKDALAAAKASAKPQVDRLPRTLNAKTITKVPKVAKPVAPALPADPFPKDITKLEDVRALGGSTGAKLVRDPATGNQFVLKRGASADHLREESHADNLYRAFGANVPEHRLYETAAGPVKLAQFVEGKTLASLKGEALETAHAQLRQHFAVDALMGNWDVIGLNADNVLVDTAGKVWRIDNGGSLRFRAMGARKSADEWNAYPEELWTLRDAGTNAQTAGVFDQLTIYDLRRQIESLSPFNVGNVPNLPTEIRDVLLSRFEQMRYVGQAARTFEEDAWKASYTDGFTRHIIGLRKAGIVEKLPKELRQEAGNVYPKDENGKLFDNLRGPGSIMQDLTAYMSRNGAEQKIIARWASEQGGNSWNDAPAAIKEFFFQQRTIERSAYWFKSDVKAEAFYQALLKKYDEAKVRTTWQIQHAITYELLGKTQMRYNDTANRFIRLIRTEDIDVLNRYGLKIGKNLSMLRGAHESSSLFNVAFPFGEETTTQSVPHHRVTSSYLFSRSVNGEDFFLGDGENEFLFLPQGIKFDYIGTRKAPELSGGLDWKAKK